MNEKLMLFPVFLRIKYYLEAKHKANGLVEKFENTTGVELIKNIAKGARYNPFG